MAASGMRHEGRQATSPARSGGGGNVEIALARATPGTVGNKAGRGPPPVPATGGQDGKGRIGGCGTAPRAQAGRQRRDHQAAPARAVAASSARAISPSTLSPRARAA